MRKFTLMLAAAAALSANVAIAQTEVSYTLDPEAGVAKDLQGITLTFDQKGVDYYENSRIPVAVLENTSTGVVYNCAEPTMNSFAETEGVSFKLMFVEESEEEAVDAITVPGEYTLTIRGFYTGDIAEETNVDLPVITAEYTINYPVAYTLTPAAGVATDLQGIVLDFPENKVEFFENNRMQVAVLENLTTGKVYNCENADLNTFSTSEGSEYILNFLDAEDELVNNISEPGEYLLTVRGMYLADDEEQEALPVILAKYTVEYPAAYTLNPEAGIATNLQGIEIVFADDVVSFYENNRMPVAVLENTTTGTEYVCNEADRLAKAEAASAYKFMFVNQNEEADEDGVLPVATEITEPGVYKLTIRGMYMGEVGEETESDLDLPVITVNYIINYPYAYTLTPAAGSTVEDLQGITLTFDDAVVSFYENNRMPVAVLENTTTGVEYVCDEADRNTFAQAGSAYTFMFKDEDGEVLENINLPGQYKLTIRGMYVGEIGDLENGEEGGTNVDLPVIVADYTVVYPVDYTLEPANGAVLEQIEKVTIDFYNNRHVVFAENTQTPVAVITNGQLGDDEVVYNGDATRNTFAESDGTVYEIKFIDPETDEAVIITTPGMWYLTIRYLGLEQLDEEGNLSDDVVELPYIYAAYYVEGTIEGPSKVVDLTSPDGLYNVYSINGVQVVKNGDINSLKSLGKGIYVVNGHKVVLK